MASLLSTSFSGLVLKNMAVPLKVSRAPGVLIPSLSPSTSFARFFGETSFLGKDEVRTWCRVCVWCRVCGGWFQRRLLMLFSVFCFLFSF